MTDTMNAAVLMVYKQFEWKQIPVPQISDHQVLIKIGYAGICGSDQHIYSGDFHPRTRTPMVPGHEFAGTVVDIGAGVTRVRVGDRVAVDPIIPCRSCAACAIGHFPACTSLKLLGVDMDGGFGEYVAADESMLYKLTDTISDRDAAMVELFSIGFHACKRAGVQQNDTILIWGTGRVGHSILQAARTKTDQTIFVADILDNRLRLAASHFRDIIPINVSKDDPVQVIADHTCGRGVDVAFESVGHAHLIANRVNPVRGCVRSIRGAGTVCVLGLADEPVDLVMKELIWKEATIIASRVSHGEFADAIHHLSLGHLKPEAMISEELPASQTQLAFEMLEKNPDAYLKIVLNVGSSAQ